jgi:hypothetical protein
MNNREVNEALILGQLSKDIQQLVALLELADPGLPGLSPLARAAWQLNSTGTVNRELAEAALDATFLIASPLGEDLLTGEHICTFECEKIDHTINIEITSKSGKKIIVLSFSSEGAVQCLLGGESPLTPSLAMSEIELGKSKMNLWSETQIFEAYKSIAISDSPAAYPCDTDFIGILTYTLTRINTEPVSGPCLSDCYNDFSCSDPGLLAEWIEGREFCWLHQLTREQAEALGLARPDGCHSDASMPDWLRDDLAISKLWITSEDLKESYEKGTASGYELEDILLCLGAGPDWQPGDWHSGVDEVDESLDELDHYPETQMPLRIIHLSKVSPCNDPNAGAVLQLLGNLVSICADQET